MSGFYDLELVALSLIVAIIASYATLELAGRVSQKQGKSAWAWLVGGTTAVSHSKPPALARDKPCLSRLCNSAVIFQIGQCDHQQIWIQWGRLEADLLVENSCVI